MGKHWWIKKWSEIGKILTFIDFIDFSLIFCHQLSTLSLSSSIIDCFSLCRSSDRPLELEELARVVVAGCGGYPTNEGVEAATALEEVQEGGQGRLNVLVARAGRDETEEMFFLIYFFVFFILGLNQIFLYFKFNFVFFIF
jgi:hypothetical protein